MEAEAQQGALRLHTDASGAGDTEGDDGMPSPTSQPSRHSILSKSESPSQRQKSERFDADGNKIIRGSVREKPKHSISFRDDKTEEGITDVKEIEEFKRIQYDQPENLSEQNQGCCTLH